MSTPRALLLGAAATLLLGLGCRAFLEITHPEKIPSKFSEDAEDEVLGSKDRISTQSYRITINKTTYIIHLWHQSFLSDDFIVYTYNRGGFVQPSSPKIKSECFYQGYIEGYPNSLAVLTTCSGLRGLLQFENISYGIELLSSSASFEHLVYKIDNENLQSPLLTDDVRINLKGNYEVQPKGTYTERKEEVSYKLLSNYGPKKETIRSHRFIEMYVVVDKALYNYLGRNREVVTHSIAILIGFVNSMFNSLNVTIVLSSLEFWTDSNKISTTEQPDQLLQSFLKWKNSYLVLRPHDVAYLLVYREKPSYVGSSFAGKFCLRNYDAGVALFQKSIPLETFSVILAQLLGLSLGMEYDDGRNCQCPGSTCVMNARAVRASGVKTFSSCSIEDFKNFMKFKGGNCLSNRPRLKMFSSKNSVVPPSKCGNGIVESGEKCDCGSPEECKKSKCCTSSCSFKNGATCSNELCCHKCKTKAKNTVCRPPVDDICDFPEFCNGTSPLCPSDIFIQNGYRCNGNTGFCYQGGCRSPDLQCQEIFGKPSRNAPKACYEEINSQADRFGHCGSDSRKGFQPCSPQNMRCGKLICVYPHTAPFSTLQVPVLYKQMKDVMCVSLDMKQPMSMPDPMLVKDGTSCGPDKVCLKQVCENYDVLNYDCNPEKKCSGHGVCNNKKNCHCYPGWSPPDCKERGNHLGGSIDSGILTTTIETGRRGEIAEKATETISDITGKESQKTKHTWIILSLCLFLPIALGSSILFVKRKRFRKYCSQDEDLSFADSESYSTDTRSMPGREKSLSNEGSVTDVEV